MAQRENKEDTELAPNTMCQSCYKTANISQPCSSTKSTTVQLNDVSKKGVSNDNSEMKDVASVVVQPVKQVNRCFGCRKRVGLTGFRCRCGLLFCSEHRYSDRHSCSFDYKAAAREAIALQNPAVRAAKIVKI